MSFKMTGGGGRRVCGVKRPERGMFEGKVTKDKATDRRHRMKQTQTSRVSDSDRSGGEKER